MLNEYRKRRNFKKTPEPTPRRGSGDNDQLKFVVQKHNASRLHYDFRLEIGGVLVSWAVPKGPSLNPEEKRLAAMTEDHPMDYGSFEGIIPKGSYGAGEVIVWDTGTYTPDENGTTDWDNKVRAECKLKAGLKAGKLSFILNGEKLHGSWTLVKMHNAKGGKNNWLLIKHKDKYAKKNVSLIAKDKSVLSNRTIEDIDRSSSQAKNMSNDQINEVIEELNNNENDLDLTVDGNILQVSNLNKVLWPINEKSKITKRDLLTYYAQVSPYLLPHLKDRPITLLRFPNGIGGKKFFQKHWEYELPEFVETVKLYSENNKSNDDYILCNNLSTLLWFGQIANLELHSWFSRIDRASTHLSTKFTGSVKNIDNSVLNYPDFIVFDLDPYIYSGKEKRNAEPELNRKAFKKTCELALMVKEVLYSLSFKSFIKTSGKTGLHLFCPIHRKYDYDFVREVAQSIAYLLFSEHPKLITTEWSVSKRKGKIFFDYNMNTRGKNIASIYSPRADIKACISTPIEWDELEHIYPTDFTMKTVPVRLLEKGDIWSNILKEKRDMKFLPNK